MKFSASKENLLEGVQVVQRAVSFNNPLPVLTGIKFTAGDGFLSLVATDLEIGAQCRIPAKVSEPGEVVLPGRYIIEVIKRLPDVNLLFTADRLTGGARIGYGKSSIVLNGFPPGEFPEVDFTPGEIRFTVRDDNFKEAVRQVSFAAAQNYSNPVFTGVLIEISGAETTLVASDMHRLAWRKLPLENAAGASIKLLVPCKTLTELTRIIGAQGEEMLISVNGNRVLFTAGRISFISRLIDGSFPQYSHVIPRTFSARVVIRTKELLEATERASLLAGDGSPVIRLLIEKDLLAIKVSSEAGRVYEEVEVEHEGEQMLVAFNARYLSDALKVVGTDKVVLEFGGPLSPAIIKPAGESRYFSLLLPVRLNES